MKSWKGKKPYAFLTFLFGACSAIFFGPPTNSSLLASCPPPKVYFLVIYLELETFFLSFSAPHLYKTPKPVRKTKECTVVDRGKKASCPSSKKQMGKNVRPPLPLFFSQSDKVLLALPLPSPPPFPTTGQKLQKRKRRRVRCPPSVNAFI